MIPNGTRAPGRLATMADLARIAGVSITTVSHVLNGTRPVSEESRSRVLQAVEETGYTPNILARSMKTATTDTIGLAAPALSKSALADLVRPIAVEARAQGLSILFADTQDEILAEMVAVEALQARRVDGILIAPARPDSPALGFLRDRNLPTVIVDRFTKMGGFDQIGTENEQATMDLTEHLIREGGHHRVALITSVPEFSTMGERLEGYRRALRANGIRPDDALIASSFDDSDRVLEVLRGFIALAEPPTAVVSANSSTTIGLMRAATAMGLRVPDDLAVVGFDDFEWADVFHPRLTVVRQRMDLIGTRAVRLLQRRIDEPDAPLVTERVATDFVHRDSCGCSVRIGKSRLPA